MQKHTIRIWLRTDKATKSGIMPIFIILSIAGKRQYLNTGISIYPEQWNDQTSKIGALPTAFAKKYGVKQADLPDITKEATRSNNLIASITTEINNIVTRYQLDEKEYDSKIIMDAYKQGSAPSQKEPEKDVLSFMENWIRKNEGIRKKGSMQVYRTVKQRLADFENYHKKQITFENINHVFFEDFQAFLASNYELNSITIAKQLSTLKTFLNKAERQEIKINLNYKTFKVERDTDLEVIALNQKEFDKLWNMDLSSNKRLDTIRDVFIFSCVTGMRFSDLEQLNRNQIKNNFISQTVTKTRMKLHIPLNKYSRAILEKYKNMPRPLPVVSNQKSNEALHDLCELAEINEPIEIVRTVGNESVKTVFPKHELITMHSGRKSFASLSLKKGMSIQNTMKIGGWKDFKSFARYVNVTNEDAQEAMNETWN